MYILILVGISPNRVDDVESDVKCILLLIMLESEHGSFSEPQPANQSDDDHAVAWGTLIVVQDQTRVEYLLQAIRDWKLSSKYQY